MLLRICLRWCLVGDVWRVVSGEWSLEGSEFCRKAMPVKVTIRGTSAVKGEVSKQNPIDIEFLTSALLCMSQAQSSRRSFQGSSGYPRFPVRCEKRKWRSGESGSIDHLQNHEFVVNSEDPLNLSSEVNAQSTPTSTFIDFSVRRHLQCEKSGVTATLADRATSPSISSLQQSPLIIHLMFHRLQCLAKSLRARDAKASVSFSPQAEHATISIRGILASIRGRSHRPSR